jgi:hypothetical protein
VLPEVNALGIDSAAIRYGAILHVISGELGTAPTTRPEGTPTLTPTSARTGSATAQPTDPRCLHCKEPLVQDDIWGWMHEGQRYLCRDQRTGELLTQAATLI